VYHRIKSYDPPLIWIPACFLKFQTWAWPYTSGGLFNALAVSSNKHLPKSNNHLLRRGLQGYGLLFAPHGLVPHFSYILADHLRLWHSTADWPFNWIRLPEAFYRPMIHYSINNISCTSSDLTGVFHNKFVNTNYEPFTPNHDEECSLPTCYRDCWHVIGQSFFSC